MLQQHLLDYCQKEKKHEVSLITKYLKKSATRGAQLEPIGNLKLTYTILSQIL